MDSSGPSARSAYAFSYDPQEKRAVLHGGKTVDNKFLDDVWSWDGAEWKLTVDAAPSARAFHAMAFDAHREELVLVGGRNGDAYLRDAWRLKDGAWSRLAGEAPPERGVYALAPAPWRASLVFHGGGWLDREAGRWRLHLDTLEWTGSEWKALP
jgi:hypothetical protein